MDLTKLIPNYKQEKQEKTEKKLVTKGVFKFGEDEKDKEKLTFSFEGDGQMRFDFDEPTTENHVVTNENAKIDDLIKMTNGSKELGERQKNVLNSLSNFINGATAKELSTNMFQDGLVPSPERNSVHPRLRELVTKGLVYISGTKTCQYTERTVSIYKVK